MPKAGKGSKGSSTAGKAKSSNCQRSQTKNMYCLDSRLYKKDPALYEKCCIEVGNQKGNYPYRKRETE